MYTLVIWDFDPFFFTSKDLVLDGRPSKSVGLKKSSPIVPLAFLGCPMWHVDHASINQPFFSKTPTGTPSEGWTAYRIAITEKSTKYVHEIVHTNIPPNPTLIHQLSQIIIISVSAGLPQSWPMLSTEVSPGGHQLAGSLRKSSWIAARRAPSSFRPPDRWVGGCLACGFIQKMPRKRKDQNNCGKGKTSFSYFWWHKLGLLPISGQGHEHPCFPSGNTPEIGKIWSNKDVLKPGKLGSPGIVTHAMWWFLAPLRPTHNLVLLPELIGHSLEFPDEAKSNQNNFPTIIEPSRKPRDSSWHPSCDPSPAKIAENQPAGPCGARLGVSSSNSHLHLRFVLGALGIPAGIQEIPRFPSSDRLPTTQKPFIEDQRKQKKGEVMRNHKFWDTQF